MKVTVTCPHCGSRFTSDIRYTLKCHRCSTIFVAASAVSEAPLHGK